MSISNAALPLEVFLWHVELHSAHRMRIIYNFTNATHIYMTLLLWFIINLTGKGDTYDAYDVIH